MEWVLRFIAIWLGASAVMLSTAWYFTMLASQYWPKWWQQNVVCPFDLEAQPAAVGKKIHLAEENSRIVL